MLRVWAAKIVFTQPGPIADILWSVYCFITNWELRRRALPIGHRSFPKMPWRKRGSSIANMISVNKFNPIIDAVSRNKIAAASG